ncbi:AMP-binding protein, partial [Geodermatophilus chilensis]|uniref:AMP-binding protein n=1 Tax=Geodermatophilus chilensis TaxID=2035835 RepID=UPI00130006F0
VPALYGVEPSDRVYQGMTIAFDFSIEEIWPTWAVGATLVAGPTDGRRVGSGLADFLEEHQITMIYCVPTVLATLDRMLPSIRTVNVGGEACPRELVDRWGPGRRILNTYGPTETTVTCTMAELRPGKPVTIGRPLPTYRITLLDDDRQPVPAGEIGEICVGGLGVAHGYVNRPDLTADRFISDPRGIPGERIYRTGDLGRFLPDVDASDAERRRIAGEVHDHAVQDLTAVAFELDAAQMRGQPRDPEDAELLEHTAQGVRQTVEDLRSLLVALIPARGSFRGGLLPALRVLAQELGRSGIRVTVRADDARELPGPTAALLYRCAQEALRNVVTHSGATSVEVAVTRHEEVATMVIEDDGQGFDESRLIERSAAGHVGLRALGELMVDAGGSLTLASAPGEGTRVVATVPLAAATSLVAGAAR